MADLGAETSLKETRLLSVPMLGRVSSNGVEWWDSCLLFLKLALPSSLVPVSEFL